MVKNAKYIINIVLIIILIYSLVSLFYLKIDSLDPNYIICMPQGGIIDMCHSIYKCYSYAKKHNRIVIIDTTKGWFNDDFNAYIQIHNPYFYTGSPDSIYSKIKDLSIRPDGIDISLLERPKVVTDGYTVQGLNATLDLSRDYKERILLYANHRNGPTHITDFLSFCSISPEVLTAYKTARARLPSYYIGIHVRNTDYVSNVPEFLEEHAGVFKDKPLFLATDNRSTIDIFRKKYGSNVHSFAHIIENNGKPLHESTIRTKEESRKYNIDTFVDIFLLASANEYYFSQKKSGFSLAVSELRGQGELLKRLLNL